MKKLFCAIAALAVISGCYKPPQHHETQDVEIPATVYATIEVAA